MFYFKCAVLVIGVIGIIANGFVLFVLAASGQLKKHAMNFPVFNQLTLDLFSSAILVVTYAFDIANIYLTGAGGYWICILILSYNILFVGLNGSMVNLAFIAIERYAKIVHPLWHKKRFRPSMAYAAMALAWFMGAVANVIYVPLTSQVIDGQCWAVVFWVSLQAQQTYGIWYFITFFVFPMTSFLYCYGRILHVVVLRRRRVGTFGHAVSQPPATLAPMSVSNSDVHSERLQMRAVKTMVILTSFFAVSWLPNHIYYLMMNINTDLSLLNTGWYLTLFIGFFNICANPFIYASKSDLVRNYVAGICAGRSCSIRQFSICPTNGVEQVDFPQQQHPTLSQRRAAGLMPAVDMSQTMTKF